MLRFGVGRVLVLLAAVVAADAVVVGAVVDAGVMDGRDAMLSVEHPVATSPIRAAPTSRLRGGGHAVQGVTGPLGAATPPLR